MLTKELSLINKRLKSEAPLLNKIGLLNGKMGVCIYFFHLARRTKKLEHQKFAEELLRQVFVSIKTDNVPFSFSEGLTGVCWGIEYLVRKNFVEGKSDEVLSPLDDEIYKYLISKNDLSGGIEHGILGYIIYILSRVNDKDISIDDIESYTFKRLLIDLVNDLGKIIEDNELFLKEPRSFDIFWDLPLCLIILSRVLRKNVYNSKIYRILTQLTPVIISLYPHLHTNRFHLLIGMECILKHIEIPHWRKHCYLLRENINRNEILTSEFKKKNIHFKDGLLGLYYLSQQMYLLLRDKSLIFDKITLESLIKESDYWSDITSKRSDDNKLDRRLYGDARHGLIGLQILDLSKK